LTIRDPAHAEVEAGRLIDPTASARRTAVISFEDIRWQLVIKGDVKGGAGTLLAPVLSSLSAEPL
jgi:hypothetical protein